jgi:hypothetical protein
MYNLRSKQNLIFMFFTSILVLSVATGAMASVRPENPVMDYVPQNIGIYDTYYENFKASDCRVCHGASTAELHHGTYYALRDKCLFCHVDGIKLEPERDCKVCHVDGGPIGNFGNPHHRSDIADSGQCNQCHLYVIKTYSVIPPSYTPTSSTPTPYSCENCHWPSGKKPHQASTYQGGTSGKAEFQTDWNNWNGFPKPTYWPDGIPHPKPIEANGPVFSGYLDEKPYIPVEGTHHEIGGNVFSKCYYCHASGPGHVPDWDSNNPYLIRYCENCHSVGTLHSIQEHISDNNIYRIGGAGNQIVTDNQKCTGCHDGFVLSDLPSLPADIPLIDRLEPDFGPPGIIVNIIPTSGQCWNEDPVHGQCSFGQKMYGDAVKMAQKDPATGEWNKIDVPIHSWSEHLIQIEVPSWMFQPGKTRIRIHKEGLGTSPFKKFIVRKHPVIYSLSPSVGDLDQVLDIGGEGFSVKKEKIYQNGYGYSTYVELTASNYKYRVTIYKDTDLAIPEKQWDQNKIRIKLKDLVDVSTGNLVPEQSLYAGCWNLLVITDYFRDDGDGIYNKSGHLDLQNSDNPADVPNATGNGDELLYRVISEPVCFTVTKNPYINSINPDPAPSSNKAVIYGANFGLTQGTSVVKVWNKKKTNFKIAKIKQWSNTKIKFVVPKFGTDPAKYPLKRWIQVEVPGKPASNYYQIIIIAPPT